MEDREFKEKELGEEWNVWRNELFPQYPFLTEDKAFESAVDFGGDESHVWQETLTPRKVLQLLGTEAGRGVIHPQIWINALMSEYKVRDKGKAHDLKSFTDLYSFVSCNSCKKPYSGYKRQHLCKNCIEDDLIQEYPSWIITDMRFLNELEAVKNKKGITIRINRPETDHLAGNHSSETALDNSEFDYVIDNTGTVDDLERKINEILIKIGLV